VYLELEADKKVAIGTQKSDKKQNKKRAVRKGVGHAFLHKQTKVLHVYLNELST
jgi:hypothetical protein